MADNTDNVPSTTTAEQDLFSFGQRRINLIWEITQAFIAIAVTGVTLYAAIMGIESTALNNTFFLVVGFYFGRTNHARAGGVAPSR